MAKCDTPHSLFLQVAIAVPLDRLFDYLAPDNCDATTLQPGVRVLVPFGKSHKIGILLAINEHSEFDKQRLKQVEQILDNEPLLSTADLKLLQWASHYYHHPLGEVLACAFPVALRQGKPAVLEHALSYSLTALGRETQPEMLKRAPKQLKLMSLFHAQSEALSQTDLLEHKSALKLLLQKAMVEEHKTPTATKNIIRGSLLEANNEQKQAISAISANLGRFSVSLLEGVTGSGKTEVYMQVITTALIKGLQILVLLPEISLTPQLEQRFRKRFSVPIVTFHSKLTDKQRLNAWLSMQQGHASIMLGTRSALFTPLHKPGLIILDEEHDTSFKQQEGFRFSARDVAIIRAKHLSIPVVLGSATPSLESLFNVDQKRYQLLTLANRAGNALAPEFRVLDIRNKKMHSGLSDPLINEIHATLAQGQQVLLFLNRRGFAPVQICHQCGGISRCQRCDANLVIHVQENVLRCHHCYSEQQLTKQCKACKTGELQALGLGTERIEHILTSLFAGKKLVRLDKDTTQRKGSLESYLEQINRGEVDIILGTQMLAKGHHFPNVTLVAILDIDSGLFSIDFRAGEKLAQMIVQVAGRAGRADKPGKVILQTRQPQHPLLMTLLKQGYRAFAQAVLQERHQASLPPFSYQALFRVHATNQEAPLAFLTALCRLLKQNNDGKIQILGPVAAPMLKRAGQFRFQLLLQSSKRQDLHSLLDTILPGIPKLKEAKGVRWTLDVDPVDLY
ncbi:primosomal protein N' [Methylomonas sp. AM2-LC]|uniref:primosomal protein N' n=1 Tax=Methylomonas sp. AM2-LC TaxID=3153301 RepID=UPI003265C2AA